MKRFDLGAEAEKLGISQGQAEDKLIAENTVHPFFLTNLKREAYDRRDDETGKYKNYDVLFPVVGEILSGGEREFTEERLSRSFLRHEGHFWSPLMQQPTHSL